MRHQLREVDVRGCGVTSYQALAGLSALTNLAIARPIIRLGVFSRTDAFALPTLPHMACLKVRLLLQSPLVFVFAFRDVTEVLLTLGGCCFVECDPMLGIGCSSV